MKQELAKLPTLDELVSEEMKSYEQDALTVLLNQNPPEKWVLSHPMSSLPYLPIDKVEYLLTRMFKRWWVEVKTVQSIANSAVVSVRLYAINPITGETMWNDGVGAAPIQTDSGKGAMDWNYAKANGVQLAAPAAETYAIKDAAEKFGRLFGKDLTRKGVLSYDSLLKSKPHKVTRDELLALYEQLPPKSLTAAEVKDAERILSEKEEASYNKLFTLFQSKINE